jgi:hypothetical protein
MGGHADGRLDEVPVLLPEAAIYVAAMEGQPPGLVS